MPSQEFVKASLQSHDERITPRAPQDHGPLTAEEAAVERQQRAALHSVAGAYDALCKRYGGPGLK